MIKRGAARHCYRVLILLTTLLFPGGELFSAEADQKDAFQKARGLMKQKQYLEAASLLENILTGNPSFVQGYRAVIDCYAALGDDQGAAIFIESLYLDNPDHAVVNYGMGYSLFKRKEYGPASSYFDKAIQLNPDLAEAWNNRAAIYQFVEKKNEKAVQYYEKAIDIGRKTGNHRVIEIAKKNLAHIPKKKDLKPVTEKLTLEAFLNRLIDAVDKNDETPTKELILGQRQNSEKAMTWLIEQAMLASGQHAKEDEKTALLLAEVLAKYYRENFNSGLLVDKLEAYKNLSDEDKELYAKGESLLQKGMMLEEKMQYTEAIASYYNSLYAFKKIQDDERTGIAYLYLGDAYSKLKEFSTACEAYQNSLKYLQQPAEHQKKAQILASAGSACFHANEYDQALNFLNQSLALYRQIDDEVSIDTIEQNIQLVKKKLE
jgi:tetratricopeptide (TPR) repeat protein